MTYFLVHFVSLNKECCEWLWHSGVISNHEEIHIVKDELISPDN